ncbi:hypothetical protein pdam_00014874 [Pocillopora damicornis]|uniref:Uncharacterized protein n=1 Tax=Pocillopora damicornis TaxID=46731 RepID=A0A3M6THT1_POCDA|nr:hypothetical protein pdam_00014874 [Pocillopora damicornis]
MLRMVFLSAACLLITLYHVLKNPCRHPIANDAETFFLVTLSLVVIINLTKATTLSFGITTDGPSGAYLKGLERFEKKDVNGVDAGDSFTLLSRHVFNGIQSIV